MSDKRITLIDTTLRDGSHAVRHSFTAGQVRGIAGGLNSGGVQFIEISHGDGLGGSSFTYGFSKENEYNLLKAASGVVKSSKITALLLPGIGTIEDIKQAKDCGAQALRVATHVTEADISAEHIRAAKSMGLFVAGFLMMVHMASPERIAEEAKKMESYGADYINLADSAGYLMPDDVAIRISAVKNAVNIPVGFHAHNNLGMAIANSLKAAQEGVEYLDGTLRGLGAGAGNAQLEVLVGTLHRNGFETGVDFYGMQDLAQGVVEPLMQRPQVITTGSMMLGYAGVYSSFLLHVYDAAKKYNLEPRDILVELGNRKMVGGQEDMILDVAYQMVK